MEPPFYAAMKAMDDRTAAVETTLERFLAMEAEHHCLFTAFDVAYKNSMKSQTTDAIKKKDEERLFFGIHRYAKYSSLRKQKRVVRGASLCPTLPIRLTKFNWLQRPSRGFLDEPSA